MLLCSLQIKVFCQLSKTFLVQSTFSRVDSGSGITESVVLLYFMMLCGTWSVVFPLRHNLKIFDPFLNLLKNTSNVSALLSISHGCIYDTNHCRLFLIFYIFLGVSAKSVSKLSFDITVLSTINCARVTFLKFSHSIRFLSTNVGGVYKLFWNNCC